MPKTLSQLRNEKGVTQRQVAEALGTAVSTIAMYETGERKPSIIRAKSLAEYYEVSIDDIFFGDYAHDMRAKVI